ncbi:MAG: hypothetical protein KDJ29_21470, partial [Hyphomicrobiales bacterium]|nr:hypothetical protein [Hyphomicrobiales bacterium]
MSNVRGRCSSRFLLALASFHLTLSGGFALPVTGAAEPTEASAGEDTPIDFNRDVRPILSDHCFACHGPDANQRKAGLRLDQAEAAHSPSDSGDIAVVPGDLEASLLVARIDTDDPYEIMPPPDAHKPLSIEQKKILRQWIQAGGQYAEHWSLVPPRRHERPAIENSDQYADAVDV